MTMSTTPDKTSEPLSDEQSPQTVVVPRPTSCTERVPKFLEENEEDEEDEEDEMPLLIFAWINYNADIFLQRWEAKNQHVSQLFPCFNRPANLLDFYSLLLQELTRDIDGAIAIGNSCIQCASSIAYGHVTNRMGLFELQPWVTTVLSGELPGCGKLADLFVTTTAHKSKALKLQGKLF